MRKIGKKFQHNSKIKQLKSKPKQKRQLSKNVKKLDKKETTNRDGQKKKPKEKRTKLEIEWDRDLKEFMRISHYYWSKKYPRFRSNYQGDKLLGYKISRPYVKIPKQYHYLSRPDKLTKELINELDKDQFVLKSVLGHQGNRVLLIVRTFLDNQFVYSDVFRKRVDDPENQMTLDQLIEYAQRKLGPRQSRHNQNSKQVPVIVEEFLGVYERDGIPPDFKVYTIGGKARMINLYFRKPGVKWEACFTRGWKRIPLYLFYRKLERLGYTEHPEHNNDILLPSLETRKKLIQTAERLARAHDAKFCRYDFYCVDGEVYLGEITPVCGGIKNMPLRLSALKHLFPSALRSQLRSGKLNKFSVNQTRKINR